MPAVLVSSSFSVQTASIAAMPCGTVLVGQNDHPPVRQRDALLAA
jgi:hypothetical protein